MNQSQEGGVISINDENDRMRFECPLSLEIMEDPVIAEDGITYEREEIERWISTPRKASPQLIASFTQAQEELAQIASNNDGTPEMQTRHQEAINAVEQIRREIETAETLTSPTTNLKMGEKLIPNTILKDIIENSIFDKEHASTQIQTEEKEVDSTEVQTEEKEVDSIDVQTPESIIDETLTENALEIVDKVSDNIIDEYIGNEMLKTRKSKARDKKKRQKKGKKERDRIEKDKALAEEAIVNARNAMAAQTITEEKYLFYGVEWEQLMNKVGLTKEGYISDWSDDIFADFYIIKAQSYAFQYLNRGNGATIKDLMKEGIPYLIHKEAYQAESFRFTPDGRVDKDLIKKEIKEWLKNIIEIQDRLLKAGFWEEGQEAEDRFKEEMKKNDSLRKDVDAFKVYRDTEKHILNTRTALLSVEMDKKYWGAATKLNNKGEEVGLNIFTAANTTIEQKFQGLFLFWLNCINLTGKMSLQEIQEFVNSMFYRMTVIQMQELNGNLPIEQWNFEMVRRGLRVGYISGAAVIAAWVRILHDFETIKLKNEQILKLSKWWSEIASHVGDGTQKGGVIYVDNENDQDDFYCPITLEVMEEPTLAEDGFSYERENIEDWFRRKKANNEPITSPKTGEVMGDKLFPNTTLKNIIQNTRFEREPTSDINTQTEEKEVDSTEVQTEEKQVDSTEVQTEEKKVGSIEVQTPKSVVDEILKENAKEIALANIIDEYIGEGVGKELREISEEELRLSAEILKTRKNKNKDKKKRQERARKERKRQEEELRKAKEERIKDATEAMNTGPETNKTVLDEEIAAAKELELKRANRDMYTIDWKNLMEQCDLKEDGSLPDQLLIDIVIDFYVESAQTELNKYGDKDGNFVVDSEDKERKFEVTLIADDAFQLENLQVGNDGIVKKELIEKELREWHDHIGQEIEDNNDQFQLLASKMEKLRKKNQLTDESLDVLKTEAEKSPESLEKLFITDKHIRNLHKMNISQEKETEYWGAEKRLVPNGYMVRGMVNKSNSLEEIFNDVFTFWVNIQPMIDQMNNEKLEELARSDFYLNTTIKKVYPLTSSLPISEWNFDMVVRGLRVGSICASAMICAWISRLALHKKGSAEYNEEIQKIAKYHAMITDSYNGVKDKKKELLNMVKEQGDLIDKEAEALSIEKKIHELEKERFADDHPYYSKFDKSISKKYEKRASNLSSNIVWFDKYQAKIRKLLDKVEKSSLSKEDDDWLSKQLSLRDSAQYQNLYKEILKKKIPHTTLIAYLKIHNEDFAGVDECLTQDECEKIYSDLDMSKYVENMTPQRRESLIGLGINPENMIKSTREVGFKETVNGLKKEMESYMLENHGRKPTPDEIVLWANTLYNALTKDDDKEKGTEESKR
tara:strand:+ start:13395 stop:17519 length:4125 start_codon:yes stop_codon:yes gene_type:complete